RVSNCALEPGLYTDTSDPYFYLRIHEREGDKIAVFGGNDHKTGQVDDTEQCFRALEDSLRTIIPDAVVEHRWSGQVVETGDGLPYIGETANKQFSATGYAGNGLTFGTLAGMMACDFVMHDHNPWEHILDPRRKSFAAAASVVAENVDYPIHMITDRM